MRIMVTCVHKNELEFDMCLLRITNICLNIIKISFTQSLIFLIKYINDNKRTNNMIDVYLQIC